MLYGWAKPVKIEKYINMSNAKYTILSFIIGKDYEIIHEI